MPTPQLLFVYGTLLSSANMAMGRAQRALLHRQCRVVGSAEVAGHLFDLGRYPGLVLKLPGPATSGAGRVAGEILALDNAEDVFAWLDRYEGISADDPAAGDYRRELRGAWLAPADPRTDGTAREVMAWVYVYQGPLAGARLLPAGRWPT